MMAWTMSICFGRYKKSLLHLDPIAYGMTSNPKATRRHMSSTCSLCTRLILQFKLHSSLWVFFFSFITTAKSDMMKKKNSGRLKCLVKNESERQLESSAVLFFLAGSFVLAVLPPLFNFDPLNRRLLFFICSSGTPALLQDQKRNNSREYCGSVY